MQNTPPIPSLMPRRRKGFWGVVRNAFYWVMGVLTLMGLVINVILFVQRVFFPSATPKSPPSQAIVPGSEKILKTDPKQIAIPKAGER